MIYALKDIIRKNDFSLPDQEVESLSESYSQRINEYNYNFNIARKMILTQGHKKRLVYSYDNNSLENVLCCYLKSVLDKAFDVCYPNRGKIMNMLFNTIPIIKDLNDFVIVRFDFKSFFDSVSTHFIYTNYIECSMVQRNIKHIFSDLSNSFKYCFAGLNTSNAMTEIACRDFDKVLRARLEAYGVVFYQRYVDDMIVILNSYISEPEIRDLISHSIDDVFENCNVKINNSKFEYISRRNLADINTFDFLGYNFTLNYYPTQKKQINFKYGITDNKQSKYKSIIRKSFVEYIQNNDVELLRHRVKAFSSRIVYSFPINSRAHTWVTKGIVSNYNELRYHLNDLDQNTTNFLKNVYFDIVNELHIINSPYFLKESGSESNYNLYSTMKRNRSIIFDPQIGIKIDKLVSQIRKLQPGYQTNRRAYYQIAKDYLDIIKIR